MNHSRQYFRLTLAGLLAAGLSSCSTSNPDHAHLAPADAVAFAAPTELTATLAGPQAINLHWKNNATAPGGGFVEFALHLPDDTFTFLGAVWPDTTTFQHSELAPGTRYTYHLQPFFGNPSEVVPIHTSTGSQWKPMPVPRVKGDDAPTLNPDTEGPLDDASSEPAGNPVHKTSIRTIKTAAEGAPTNLTVRLSSPTGVDLRWADRAADEDGYLVEVSLPPDKDFRVCAELPPDTTSFRKTGLPPETTCYFRVRAFFYGQPSNLASVTTLAESAPDPARKTN